MARERKVGKEPEVLKVRKKTRKQLLAEVTLTDEEMKASQQHYEEILARMAAEKLQKRLERAAYRKAHGIPDIELEDIIFRI